MTTWPSGNIQTFLDKLLRMASGQRGLGLLQQVFLGDAAFVDSARSRATTPRQEDWEVPHSPRIRSDLAHGISSSVAQRMAQGTMRDEALWTGYSRGARSKTVLARELELSFRASAG